jgi:hypothetical protein
MPLSKNVDVQVYCDNCEKDMDGSDMMFENAQGIQSRVYDCKDCNAKVTITLVPNTKDVV